jgi:hypothetical protein
MLVNISISKSNGLLPRNTVHYVVGPSTMLSLLWKERNSDNEEQLRGKIAG